ncbi:MAG: hypothetical protein ABMB14_07390 [Myxococcota bacterium]
MILGYWVTVNVFDPTGLPSASAEVFVDGAWVGSTDATGTRRVMTPIPHGSHLMARKLVETFVGYKPDHDGWVARVYQASREVGADGALGDYVIPEPVQYPYAVEPVALQLNVEQPVIGLHLVVSLSWDASDAELEVLEQRFRDASQYLYDATDGQFLIEELKIADDGQLWDSADIQFDLDNTRRPYSSWPGGFLSRVLDTATAVVTIAPMASGYWSDQPQTLIHELGHLALGLGDEYMGTNWNAQNFCTGARFAGHPDPDYERFGQRAACVMDNQIESNKFCSGHPANDPRAHRSLLFQPGPCWDTIDATYSDRSAARDWSITKPEERPAVVGMLAPLPSGWEPKITRMNNHRGVLCAPFRFTQPSGVAGDDMWVFPSDGSTPFTLGVLDGAGSVLVSGIHATDIIVTSRSAPTTVTKCNVAF